MQDTLTSRSINLYPQRRVRGSQTRIVEARTDSYLSSTPLGRAETQSDEDEERPVEKRAKSARRQGVLAFSNGQLLTKKPLVNPIGRNDARRVTLAEVAEETWKLLPGLLVTRPDVTTNSFLCRKETLDPKRCPRLPPIKVAVVDADTIDAALAIQKDPSRHVAVLNMANTQHAGGGWRHGALAQEEALCYRTSLSKTLHKKHYPIPEDAAIYSPTVMVIRESMKDGHDLLDFRDPSKLDIISVISCAAVCQPFLDKDQSGKRTYRNAKDVSLMMEKMRVILRTAIRNKHRQIVLGAFGCGAFGNPNLVVAAMWRQVLLEAEFSGGYWEHVVFAVLDGGAGNLKVFHEELDGLLVQ